MGGQSLEVYQTLNTFQTDMSFIEAASSVYSSNMVLLGYVSEDELEILPKVMPSGSHALVIAEN